MRTPLQVFKDFDAKMDKRDAEDQEGALGMWRHICCIDYNRNDIPTFYYVP